ncbi:phage tail sheath subtilisin-like domain-containing protein [Nostoc sp. FACHB-110]|uniref:phage tail sheath family protein n=1 Tax=Nostoc sp. FACHB-110 TaxID=2692834 RepID=UPI001682DDE1|nr:phage tail sheath subtilisin-like domain-containing protein [Nostoc sp. FACHB-110]MBD2438764.1 phage tail sheath family protein [Nostoc sp. FACHB-110]
MPTYLSPGVYVEEIASGSAPIVGVGTSIAAFIGTIKANVWSPNNTSIPSTRSVGSSTNPVEIGTSQGGTQKNYSLIAGDYPIVTTLGSYGFFVDGSPVALDDTNPVTNNDADKSATIKFKDAVASGAKITGYYQVTLPVTVTPSDPNIAKEGEIKLITNFSEFKKFFGDFLPPTGDSQGQNTLAHTVYGFFRNGGTRCYVTWVTGENKIGGVLEALEAIDEISIVVAPGNLALRDDIKDHCEKLGDRIAILDSPEVVDLSGTGVVNTLKPFNSTYAALYFPWIQVFDPASNDNIYIPPSGHIAGVYARVDGQRGVYKAPANENILGALDLKYNLSKAKQDGLNPDGINVIRKLNGNIRVWGARTLGGDANTEFKYVNIRRHFSYLRDSIDKGTQWTVFEPNTPELWAKIRRNISAFLVMEWRRGALFGTTPEEAFYVKCDAENNPPEVRDLGQVVTEIGLAVVKPAEFVIFRLSQWAGAGK